MGNKANKEKETSQVSTKTKPSPTNNANDVMSDQVKLYLQKKEEARKKIFSDANMAEIVRKQLEYEQRHKATQTPPVIPPQPSSYGKPNFEIEKTLEILLLETKLQQQREQMEAMRKFLEEIPPIFCSTYFPFLEAVPPEILHIIFNCLDIRTRIRCTRVSKVMANIIKTLFPKEFNMNIAVRQYIQLREKKKQEIADQYYNTLRRLTNADNLSNEQKS